MKEVSTESGERPFIIWTLQRTGGTNFTRALMARSSFKKTQDEPFNKPREFGYVTKFWVRNRDQDRLESDIQKILQREKCIKHCVEQVPEGISLTLAAISTKFDYRHIFLYRQNALDRLLSREYALRAGAWGVSHAKKLTNDSWVFEKELDVEALVQHEEECVLRLQKIWTHLELIEGERQAVSFEEIYDNDLNSALTILGSVLEFLSLQGGRKSTQRFVSNVRDTGNQKTRDRYRNFKGWETLDERLVSAPHFSPGSSQKKSAGPAE